MGTKKPGPGDGKTPSVFSEDLLTVNIDRDIGVPDTVSDEAEIEGSGFVRATEESMKHVVPGCFVMIQMNQAYVWAEILAINGDTIVGRLHSELSKSPQSAAAPPTKAVFFRFNQVKALGCERYCWC